MRGSKAVAKSALPFRSPHDSVDVVGTRIVLYQSGQEIPVVRIVDAQRVGVPPVQISLLQFLDVRQIAAEYVLEPANDLHAALLCCGKNFGQDIEVSVVGRACVFENSIFVVLRMRSGEISAVKIKIVFLLAMIGQRLAGNLSPSDAATVGEDREKQRIHAGSFLKRIEDFLGAFIYKGNRSDLDTDHSGCDSSMAGIWHGQGGARSGGKFEEFSAIHIQFQHGLVLSSLVAPDVYNQSAPRALYQMIDIVFFSYVPLEAHTFTPTADQVCNCGAMLGSHRNSPSAGMPIGPDGARPSLRVQL